MKIRTILTIVLISWAAAVVLAEPEPMPVSSGASAEWQRAQEEMKQKEQEMRRAAEELKSVERKLRDIKVTVPHPVPTTGRPWYETMQRGTDRILIIPSGDMKPEQLDAIKEDLMIMSRILAKQYGQQSAGGFGNPYIGAFFNGSSTPETIFIDGYGALFMFEVDFLLSPPQQKEEQETEESSDSEWDRTKKELFSPSETIGFKQEEPEKKAQYNEERVKRVEHDLIDALKHAANIRNLDEGEQLVIVVRCVEEFTGARFKFLSDGGSKIVLPSRTTGSKTSQATDTMVIRVDKRHIDGFSEGKLGFDEFRDKVEIIKY